MNVENLALESLSTRISYESNPCNLLLTGLLDGKKSLTSRNIKITQNCV